MFLYIPNPNNAVVILRFAILTSYSVDKGRSIQIVSFFIKICIIAVGFSVLTEIQAPAKEAKTCISAFRLEDLRNVAN
jgi:hypothetical protein